MKTVAPTGVKVRYYGIRRRGRSQSVRGLKRILFYRARVSIQYLFDHRPSITISRFKAHHDQVTSAVASGNWIASAEL